MKERSDHDAAEAIILLLLLAQLFMAGQFFYLFFFTASIFSYAYFPSFARLLIFSYSFSLAAKDTNDDHKWNKINDSKKRELERKMLMIIKI